ncbi:Ig-like domain-containing protein [Enterovibrio norvegicus]|uniref:Ig-like domain-containing protein n=1 Tax=Enterovibrio norvegicus TaxID=188144 RepID=UPI00352D63A6
MIRAFSLMAVLLFGLMSTCAVAKSIIVTGTIQAKLPTVRIIEPNTYYRGVKEYRVEALTGADSVCELTDNVTNARDNAIQDGSLLCLFEWVSDSDPNFIADGMDLIGRPQSEAGTKERTYRISFFSGSNRDKVVLLEETITYELVPPPPVQIKSIVSQLGSADLVGTDHVTYNRDDRLSRIKVNVEPRPYDTVFTITHFDRECEIAAGDTSCTVLMGNLVLPADDFTLTGLVSSDFVYSDKFDFQNVQGSLTYRFDYRPPVIEQFAVRSAGDTSNKEVSLIVDGQKVVANNDEALVVLSSPHLHNSRPDRWWLPSKMRFNVVKDETVDELKDFVTIGGEYIGHLFKSQKLPEDGLSLVSTGFPQQYGDKFVYRVSLKALGDGYYTGTLSAEDIYGNGTSADTSQILIDRTEPEILIFNSKKGWERIYNGSDIVFWEHLVVTAQDYISRDLTITNIKIDDETIDIEGEWPMAKALRPSKEYESDTVRNLKVTVEDAAGNTTTKELDLSYLPINHTYSGVSHDKYSLVQAQTITLEQTSGPNCRLYGSEKLALQALLNRNHNACSIEWVEIPKGLEIDASYPTDLVGAFEQDGQAMFHAKTYIHDDNARKSLIEEHHIAIDIQRPKAPEIIFDERTALREGVYPIELSKTRMSRYSVRAAAAPVRIVLHGPEGVIDEVIARQPRRKTYNDIFRTITDREGLGIANLWDERQYTVKVNYVLDPTVASEKSAVAVMVPSSRIKIDSEIDDSESFAGGVTQGTVTFGMYDRLTRRLAYNPETMGDWEVRYAFENRDRSLTPIGDWVKYQEVDEMKFPLQWNDQDEGKHRIVAQARLVSQLEGYDHFEKSGKDYLYILKGGALDGELRYTRLAGAVPFTATLSYRHATAEDRDATGSIEWLVSNDSGQTWSEEGTEGTQIRFKAENSGRWQIKALVTNRKTGIESESEVVEVVGYVKPRISIDAPKAVIVGMPAIAMLTDHGTIADNNDLLIQWSTDNGKTFVDGTEELDVSSSTEGNIKLMVKAVYRGYEQEEKSWDYDTHTLRVYPAKSNYLRLKGDDELETGITSKYNVTARSAYGMIQDEVVIEWTDIDGEVVQSDELEITPELRHLSNNGHYTVKVRSWLRSAKMQTFIEESMDVKVWRYEFPDFTTSYKQQTVVAPSQFDVFVKRPLDSNLSENITYSWNTNGESEVLRTFDTWARFLATEPGLYPITVDISDDRGNSTAVTTYVEVLDPKPVEFENIVRFDNNYMRYPLGIYMRSNVQKGHPSDKVTEYTWYLNGEKVVGEDRYFLRMEDLPVGSHEVKMHVLTEYGQEGETTEEFTVIPNSKPSCSINVRKSSGRANIKADCNDPDGKVVNYQWYVDGDKRSNMSYRIVESLEDGKIIEIRMIATDDSGDTTEATKLVGL